MLLTSHNLAFMLRLMKMIREAIENDRFTEYKREFMEKYDRGLD